MHLSNGCSSLVFRDKHHYGLFYLRTLTLDDSAKIRMIQGAEEGNSLKKRILEREDGGVEDRIKAFLVDLDSYEILGSDDEIVRVHSIFYEESLASSGLLICKLNRV